MKNFLLLILLCIAAGCREPKLEDYTGTYESHFSDVFKYLIIKDSAYYFSDYEGWIVDPITIENYEDADSLTGDSITIALAKGLHKTEDRLEWLREKYTEHQNLIKFSLFVPEHYPDLILCVENYDTGEKIFGETMDKTRHLSIFLPFNKVPKQPLVFYTYDKATGNPFKGCLLITNDLTLRSIYHHTQYLTPIPLGSGWEGHVLPLAFTEDQNHIPLPPLKKPYKPLHEAIPVEDLYRSLQDNEAMFWDNDTVSVRGVIKNIPSKSLIILSSEDEDNTFTIECSNYNGFPKTDLENIRRGDILYVQGRLKENFKWFQHVSSTEKITLTHCSILN